MGVWSNLKSPVWTIVPSGVRSAMPMASGIEWPMRNGSAVKGTDLHGVARFQVEQRVVVELVLLDLVAKQAARQRGGVDRHAGELGQHVRQPADVVLVRVRDQERLDLVAPLLEVGDVADDQVDAEHLLVREGQAAVDDDDVVAVLEDGHVPADLADAAEGHDPPRFA